MILTTALVACGGKGGDQPAPEPEPTAPSEPAPTEPTPEPATVAAEPDAGAAAAPSDPATAAPTGETVAAGDGDATGGAAENAADAELGFVYPAKNTVIRDVDPESIEGVIQRALMAAANPDEEKGWKDFESLLHSQEKGEMSLRSRKQYNWPAMRRKAYLFLIEGTDKNVYKWAYAEEHDEGKTIKVFVYNPKSSPTPCYVKRDPEQENHWRITTCSL
ncbi:MAG: hypothetical protein H6745_26070 [Deltaproteobacteria bacterium]|nr:hypothetical protein [Deltaproteobacteria bacterium]